jgi:hypothetical protein
MPAETSDTSQPGIDVLPDQWHRERLSASDVGGVLVYIGGTSAVTVYRS